jgi:hypothetical protein
LLLPGRMNRARGFLLGLSILLLSSGRAWAQADGAVAPAPSPPQYLDYRYQLVLSDVATVGLLVATTRTESWETTRPMLLASLATYALVPPTIHLVHEQPLRALGSFGLRVGGPFVGAGLGLVITAPLCAADQGEGWGCLGAAVLFVGGGFFAGIVGGMIVDDAVLGRVELPRKAARSYRPGTVQASLVPIADPKRKSIGLSLSGTF